MFYMKDEEEYWAWKAEAAAEKRRLTLFAIVCFSAFLIYLAWR